MAGFCQHRINAALILTVQVLVLSPHVSDGASVALRRASAALRSHRSVEPEHSLEPGLAAARIVAVSGRGPVRVARGGNATGSGKTMGYDSEAGEAAGQTIEGCGTTTKVHSGSNKKDSCPAACPFYVQDRRDWDFCTFSCVAEPDCVTFNPKTQIGDKAKGICRSCVVGGCLECDTSVTDDRCAKCQAGYYLKDGQCWFKYGGAWVSALGGVLAGIGALVLVWLLEWSLRPTVNQAGLDYALEQKERTMLKMPKDEGGLRRLFPLMTNLLRQQVAGPGMTLHFNFQVFLIIWALFVAIVWMCFAHFVDEDLWRLGTRKFGTPRENCILVMWGYERQQTLMWTKTSFLWIVYLGSFLMCMIYGISQLRKFQNVDFENKTMKDFVAMVVGLPQIDGERDVEEELKVHLEEITGQTIVGVSVAWDWQEHQEAIEKALDEDLQERIYTAGGEEEPPETAEPEMGVVRRCFFQMEQKLLGLDAGEEEEEEGEDAKPVEELLLELKTSPRAFVVFETQLAKEEAVDTLQDGFEFEGTSGIVMEALDAEPDTVQWVNYGNSTRQQKILRLCIGFGCILLACLFWAVVFYAPYAYYVMTFNYENGREPGFEVGFAFSMIVVVGNAIMYEVCAQISDRVGFQFKDDREACYMILYTIACMFNVALDFVTTYFTAEKVMEGLGFRTYFGEPLHQIDSFTSKFESYGMQRSLAENTYSYAFPSTYLIPFLIEPFPAVIMPILVGRLIVRTHPELQGKAAEEWMAMAPMEMGRYADLLLNIILGILIFYFPGGYTWMLFLAMAASHLWIYVFDHYRVLRAIPSCTFAAYDIEWWCQAMLAPIIGIIASCLAFKLNCEGGMYCLGGVPLIATCSCAWLVHTIFHTMCLVHVLPKFGKREPEEDPLPDETFMSLAQRVPCTWFTANPIWCLRSKYKYNHFPPCSYHHIGKEQYMRVNEKIGCFFDETDEKLFEGN